MTDVAAPTPEANPRPQPRRHGRIVPRERQPAGPRDGARPADPAPAHPAQHDRRRHRRPAHLRGRGNQGRQRGLGRPADLRRPDDRPALSPRRTDRRSAFLTLLAREAHDRRPHRARAAPSRPVRRQRLQRHARRRGRVPDSRAARAWRRTAASPTGRRLAWRSASATCAAIEGATVEVDGQRIDWTPGSGSVLSSLKARPRRAGAGRPGDGLGALQPHAGRQRQARSRAARRRTEATLSSPWPAPSFTGRSPAQPDRRQGRLSRPLVGVASRPAIRPALGQCQLRNEPGA